jgi:cobalt/nickel transport system permease protein
MHMSDALITPLVGGTMLATSSGAIGYSIKTLKAEIFEKRLPLMAVMGAFLFAIQMINFAIPGTGSSGHIGGGMLLAIVLGPAAGFLTMACVLLIQALFFADGGLLAFGCNLINLGFFTAFVAYPLVFKPIIGKGLSKGRIIVASLLAAVVGLQLGSIGVVVETIA